MSHEPKSCLLLGEGVTDLVVVNSLCDAHGLPADLYDYEDLKGVEKLLRKLPTFLKESGRRQIAVVLDADQHPAGRWQGLRDSLLRRETGYVLPECPSPGGTVIPPPTAGRPGLSIWLWPDNTSAGVLEDFLKKLVPEADPLFIRALRNVGEIPTEERRFGAFHLSKAELYTWAAWQEEPGRAFGDLIRRGELDPAAAPAQELMTWVRRAFL